MSKSCQNKKRRPKEVQEKDLYTQSSEAKLYDLAPLYYKLINICFQTENTLIILVFTTVFI